jgi:hypothetical protein
MKGLFTFNGASQSVLRDGQARPLQHDLRASEGGGYPTNAVCIAGERGWVFPYKRNQECGRTQEFLYDVSAFLSHQSPIFILKAHKSKS